MDWQAFRSIPTNGRAHAGEHQRLITNFGRLRQLSPSGISMQSMTTSLSNQWGSNLQKAQTHQPDWDNYVVTKVKNVRAALLSGIDTFQADGFTVPMASGFIELSGMRAGAYRTFLKIGFTESNRVVLPSFQLVDNSAVGTLILPTHCFGSTLQFANSPMAHFRIGGDGRRNAMATDVALLNFTLTEPEVKEGIEVGFINSR